MKKRILIPILTLFLIFIRINIVYAETSYFDNKELVDASNLSISQMQNVIQSVAEQYLNKKTLTDYEQKAMDTAEDKKTFNFRNFNMTPFDLSRSNPNNFDCSSFVTNVYMNAFGFSFIDYYTLSSIPATTNYVKPNDNKISTLLTSSSSLEAKEKELTKEYNNLKSALLYSGKGISTGILEKVAKDTSKDNSKLTTFIWDNSKGTKDISQSAINKMIKELYSNLETGDILLTRKITTDGSKSGHVTLYVKEHYNPSTGEWSEGFIHSQGKDYPMDPYNFMNTTNYGEDSYSVRYIRKTCYVEDCKPDDGQTTGLNFTNKNKTRVYFVAIIRPLNVIKTGKYINIYNNKKNNTPKTTKEISTLANYFSEKNNLSMQQYLYNKTEGKRIYQTNEIKSGEEIYVKYYFYNKSNKTITFNIQYTPTNINAHLYTDPNLTTDSIKNYFYYTSNDAEGKHATVKRTIENNVVTMKVILKPKQYINTYYKLYYKNDHNTKEKLTFDGAKIYLSDKVDNSKLITFNKMYANAVGNKYKEATKNVYNNIFNYYYTNKKKIKEKQKDSIYDLFNLNDNPQSIINTLFSECNKNYYYGIECSGNNNTGLTNEKNKLKSMVVEGMYGGQRVRGNTDNSRTRRISFDYLEPGDIIIGCRYNTYCQTIVYNGKKEVKNVKTNETKIENITFAQLYSIKDGNETIYHLEQTSKKYLMNILTYDVFVVLRPLREMQYDSPLLSQITKKETKQNNYVATFLSNENSITSDEGIDEDIIITNIEENINDNEEDEVSLNEEGQTEEEINDEENTVEENSIESDIEEENYMEEEETENIDKNQNITVNPETGIIGYILSIVAIIISAFLTLYYFKNNKKNKEQE